jgi:homocysteine S-methyltransferase
MTAPEQLVTDGGLETDLIFHHGIDLPDFAAFPVLGDAAGRSLLSRYYEEYAAIAERAGAGLLLETPTWRASSDWGTRLGYDASALAAVNRDAVSFLRAIGDRWADRLPTTRVSGQVGPRGDGYRPGAAVDPDDAAAYHRPQIAAFAEAGADIATALTLTDVGEALGVVAAARDVGLPVAIAFTVETDGRLPGGTSLPDAIAAVDAAGGPEYFLVNCAHPEHVERGLGDDGPWRERIHGLRVNASTQSHAELDEATELDDGDPEALARAHDRLEGSLPSVRIVGGCCGTDSRHVAALWRDRAGATGRPT